MKQQHREIILKMCDCSMNTSEVAREMHYSRINIYNHLIKIKELTGLDPKNFYDLLELRNMALAEMEK